MSSLKFGTSGLRGLVTDLVGAPSHAWSLAFLTVMAARGTPRQVLIGRDLRSSSEEIAGEAACAAASAGFTPVDCGALPTPALALEAARRGAPAIMVTGSHIPEDRNGLKFYSPQGEITKADEADILAAHAALPSDLPRRAPQDVARADALERYAARYREAFGDQALAGLVIGVYQHSSVARDLLVALLAGLGARTVPIARASAFVPVDTEAHRPEDKALLCENAQGGSFDAIVSTDGDADRPLVADEAGGILRGDLLGLLTAKALGLSTIVTPVTSGSAMESSGLVARVHRTRVGSPFVIAAMDALKAADAGGIAGFEANGGFLLGSDVNIDGRRLAALQTRDAMLPIIAVLMLARREGKALSRLVADLGVKAAASHRLQDIPTERCQAFIARLGADEAFRRHVLADLGQAAGIDLTDGIRMTLENGSIVHFRASGNAPELRCYAEAEGEEAAQALVRKGLDRAAAAV